MMTEDPLFTIMAKTILDRGKPYTFGTWLRHTAHLAQVICQECGVLPLPYEIPEFSPDWMTLCQEARDHARETGHEVAVTQWNGAIYGPEAGAGDA
jgi:hypothetical protein